MGSTLQRHFRDIFILRGSENENRRLRRRLKQPIERLDSGTVREGEVDQDRGDVFDTLFLQVLVGQAG